MIRYDFGIHSRYTQYIKEKPDTPEALFYLGYLIEREKEIKELFSNNGLTRYEVYDSSVQPELFK